MKVTGTKIGFCHCCKQVIHPDQDHNCTRWNEWQQKLGEGRADQMRSYKPIVFIGEAGSVDISGSTDIVCETMVHNRQCIYQAVIESNVGPRRFICLSHTPFIQQIVKDTISQELGSVTELMMEAIGKGDFTFGQHGSFLSEDRYNRLIELSLNKNLAP